MGQLLERALPAYEFSELHETLVEAPPERVFAALKAVTPAELPLTRLLLEIRGLPSLIVRRTRPVALHRTLLDSFADAGFLVLAEDRERELVLGAVGRFWRPIGNLPVPVRDPAGFTAFEEPDHAKAAVSFELAPAGDATRLITETHIQTTADPARRKFARYWRLIRPWSGLIRREMLRAVRRRATRGDEPFGDTPR
jgi:hypothetical protein